MQLLAPALVLALGAVCPAQTAPTGPAPADCNPAITPEQLLAVAPKAAACDGPRAGPECRTAQAAAAPLSASFKKYGICAPAAQAVLLATVALESGEFQYQRNRFPAPGNPGQGTRNMQSKQFNYLYSQSLGGDVAAKAKARLGGADPKAMDNDAAKAVLDLVLGAGDEVDFGSAAWFITSQEDCKPALAALNGGDNEQGFSLYLTKCLYTTMTDERKQYHDKAVQAIGKASGAAPAAYNSPGSAPAAPSSAAAAAPGQAPASPSASQPAPAATPPAAPSAPAPAPSSQPAVTAKPPAPSAAMPPSAPARQSAPASQPGYAAPSAAPQNGGDADHAGDDDDDDAAEYDACDEEADGEY